jgi:glutathione S-transferase
MITITAMKWAPPFAAGMVRDHRARWILEEVGWPYEVRLLDAPDLASEGYRHCQPFGQVPCLEEDGRPVLFESGAIVIDVATRAGKLLPADEGERARALCWVVAALNSVEPALMNVAEVEYFTDDRTVREARRPTVVAFANRRLSQLDASLGDRDWLVGGAFSIADLMMGSVLRIAHRLHLLEQTPRLVAYHDRCIDRPAFRKAVSDQCATISAHAAEDMRYKEAQARGA